MLDGKERREKLIGADTECIGEELGESVGGQSVVYINGASDVLGGRREVGALGSGRLQLGDLEKQVCQFVMGVLGGIVRPTARSPCR